MTPTTQEYVYLIGSRKFGWYKIGKAIRPNIRVSELGILLPFRIDIFGLWSTSKGLTTERLMHEKYAGYSINGEWFGIPLQSVVEILRDVQPFDSQLIFSVFEPHTYEIAEKLGVKTNFSNMDNDRNINSKGIRGTRRKLRMEFFSGWFEQNGIEPSQENWKIYGPEIHQAFLKKYGHMSKEQLAFCGGYIV